MPERTIVVMPAYEAEATLERVVHALPDGSYDEIIVVDDGSRDRTAEIAGRLPVTLIRHDRNRGYGANQKTCYRAALAHGADLVVMLHPDYQYHPGILPVAREVLALDICDVVLGNRIRTRREALAGGMPLAKYLANRTLTFLENLMAGQNLGDWHSGFRAYRRRVLETVPFEHNSDGFVFDSQLLVQAVHFGFRLGDVPVPARYLDEASTIPFGAAARYALATLATFGSWFAHRTRLRASPLFARHGPLVGSETPADTEPVP